MSRSIIPKERVRRFISTDIAYFSIDPFALILDDGTPEVPVCIINTGLGPVWLGFNNDAVTEDTGVPIMPGRWLHINHDTYFGDTADDANPGTLYAVAPGGGQEVAVLRNLADFSEDVFAGIVAARRGIRGSMGADLEALLLAAGDHGLYRSNIDFTATRNTNTVLDIADLGFAPEQEDFLAVAWPEDPNKPCLTASATEFVWTPDPVGTTGELEVSEALFEAGEVFVVLIRGPVRAYDKTTDALLAQILNQRWNQDTWQQHADESPGTDGTHTYDIDVEGAKSLTIRHNIGNGSGTVTLTVEATERNDGTAPGSLTFIDVTADLSGSASFTGGDDRFIEITDLPAYKYIRLKIEAASTANDGSWYLASLKGY